MSDAISLLKEQQAKVPERSAPWMVAQQLMDICRAEPYSAELIAQDLENKALSIVEAEKKIKAFADKHNTGSFSCVTPAEAEDILREFYGLPIARASAEAPYPADAGRDSRGQPVSPVGPLPASGGLGLNLADFL